MKIFEKEITTKNLSISRTCLIGSTSLHMKYQQKKWLEVVREINCLKFCFHWTAGQKKHWKFGSSNLGNCT